jgi:hypothetical protein
VPVLVEARRDGTESGDGYSEGRRRLTTAFAVEIGATCDRRR